MRRLLVFGTGAAVVGIVLLIVAFYEAYLIVSTLQKEVGQQITNTNLLLEDATLEAVFLGVMAALGYGLVAKGLDGIRRQELLEMEGFAQETYGRGPFPARLDQSRGEGRPPGEVDVTAPPAQEKPPESHPGIKKPVDRSVRLAKVAYPQAGKFSEEKEPQETAWEESREQARAAELRAKQEMSSPESSSTALSRETTERSTSSWGSSSQPASAASPPTQTVTSSVAESKPGQIVWEGGAPPDLVGVEVLPEPAMHGPGATKSSDAVRPGEAEVQRPWISGNLIPPTPKRGRGRPRGSKTAKKTTETPPDGPVQPESESPSEPASEPSSQPPSETQSDTTV